MNLQDRILSRIKNSEAITRTFRKGTARYCPTTQYIIDSILTLEQLHNGCDCLRVYIDGTEIQDVDLPAQATLEVIRVQLRNLEQVLLGKL